MTDADESSLLRQKLGEAMETITELEHEVATLRAVSTQNGASPDLAEGMFNAYNEQGPNPWKTFDGRDVPRWRDLNDQVRAKWAAAAAAARLFILSDSHDSELAR